MSKAEEIEKMNEYIKKYCSFTPHKTDDPFGVRKAMQEYYNSRQSEIDELKAEVEMLKEDKTARYKAGQSHMFIPPPCYLDEGIKGKHGYYDDQDGFWVEWLGPEVAVCIRKDGVSYKQSVTEFIKNAIK